MSDIDSLKAEIKKLSSRAINAKMNLHDLSEELPVNWQSILTVAQETYDAFKVLEEARNNLKQLEANAT
ncbi:MULTISPECIES: CCE_0567 family metalloprotein [Rhodopseudomonas]|uniref:Uncharacterized protein n=1 Tax=Rhodopseudomonas palustris TaxID=1076 RepID=A0A0D7E462_RHOPL|nr:MULTISPECIES: CCE_0567 family metalloprotein [Rhodopseudomonas]KIZ35301.1 hypothetical protein OO17_25895 [Rhodopseudomonas palustris]MDF3809074.1 CCE_0567 family metalloprotein [Rhodopseudomonas sp. BAL398]WOK15865.1 CCE_0567 family metalloprotein [Rhodopseudomonas sp. BAL398]